MKILGLEVSKKRLIGIVAFVGIVGSVATAVILLKNSNNKVDEQKIEVVLNDNLEFEINSEVKLLSLVSEENKAEIISEDEIIDTSILGEKEIVIKYKDKEEKEFKFKICIIDTQAPTIEYQKKLSTIAGTKIDLLKDVKVSDNSNEKIQATIEGDYYFDKEGTYNLKYVAVDSSNNKKEEEFTLKVNKKPIQSSNNNKTQSNNTTSNNSNNTTSGGIDSSGFDPSELLEDTCRKCFSNPLPAYSFTDEYNWHYNTAVHVRRTTFYWYISKVDKVNGEVVNVEWDVACNSGLSMPAKDNAKAYMPTPPSGQQAIDMYYADSNVTYGNTILYVVLP